MTTDADIHNAFREALAENRDIAAQQEAEKERAKQHDQKLQELKENLNKAVGELQGTVFEMLMKAGDPMAPFKACWALINALSAWGEKIPYDNDLPGQSDQNRQEVHGDVPSLSKKFSNPIPDSGPPSITKHNKSRRPSLGASPAA